MLELDDDQREAAVRVGALIERLDAGDPAALSAVREISRDRLVLGEVLGDYLHRVVQGTQAEVLTYWPVLELLRRAGADEERAATRAASLRAVTSG